MLRRSQTLPARLTAAIPAPVPKASTRPIKPLTSKRIQLPAYLKHTTTAQLDKLVAEKFLELYLEPGHAGQIQAVVSLLRGKNTFLLAGTGFGKTRVAEVFLRMFPEKLKPVMLVVNPLDSLGDNQVSHSQIAKP